MKSVFVESVTFICYKCHHRRKAERKKKKVKDWTDGMTDWAGVVQQMSKLGQIIWRPWSRIKFLFLPLHFIFIIQLRWRWKHRALQSHFLSSLSFQSMLTAGHECSDYLVNYQNHSQNYTLHFNVINSISSSFIQFIFWPWYKKYIYNHLVSFMCR